jgi:ATP-dependent RNA helicase RhlE
MSFNNLGLSEPLIRAATDAGYTQATPIQLQAIPAVLSGKDLLAGAQTGTGKTAGFLLPILQRLADAKSTTPGAKPHIRVLILTPTRELAAQVEQSAKVYGKYMSFKSTVIFGGVGMNPQINALRQGVDIVVATPGRLLDLHGQRVCDLSKVEMFVLDEADRMLDMGFVHDIKKVLAILPQQVNGVRRQNLLFSATFSEDIKNLADRLLNNPALIEVARRNTTAEMIQQKVHFVDRDRKRELLAHLIKQGDWHQVLVFTRTKHGADRLVKQLEQDAITAMAIHGNKGQNARTRALANFKDGDLRVLVATDIAARGIDIDQLPHVINYDLPNVPEDYVHRIGRTGRAGASGEAISFVTVDETNFLADIEALTKQRLPREVVAGFEADMTVPAEPVSTGRQTLWGAPKPPGWKAPPKEVRGGGQRNTSPRPARAESRPAGAAAAPKEAAQNRPLRPPRQPKSTTPGTAGPAANPAAAPRKAGGQDRAAPRQAGPRKPQQGQGAGGAGRGRTDTAGKVRSGGESRDRNIDRKDRFPRREDTTVRTSEGFETALTGKPARKPARPDSVVRSSIPLPPAPASTPAPRTGASNTSNRPATPSTATHKPANHSARKPAHSQTSQTAEPKSGFGQRLAALVGLRKKS